MTPASLRCALAKSAIVERIIDCQRLSPTMSSMPWADAVLAGGVRVEVAFFPETCRDPGFTVFCKDRPSIAANAPAGELDAALKAVLEKFSRT